MGLKRCPLTITLMGFGGSLPSSDLHNYGETPTTTVLSDLQTSGKVMENGLFKAPPRGPVMFFSSTGLFPSNEL